MICTILSSCCYSHKSSFFFSSILEKEGPLSQSLQQNRQSPNYSKYYNTPQSEYRKTATSRPLINIVTYFLYIYIYIGG